MTLRELIDELTLEMDRNNWGEYEVLFDAASMGRYGLSYLDTSEDWNRTIRIDLGDHDE